MTKYFKEIDDGNMDQDFLTKLDSARELADIPFKINSAFRTVENEIKNGRDGSSSHTKGIAVDISTTSSVTRYKVLKALLDVGFNRIGIAETFIHVDDDKDKSPGVIWDYY